MNLQRYDLDAESSSMGGYVEMRPCNVVGEWVKASEAEAEIAAKDARIKKLEDALAIAYFGVRELQNQFEFCDCSDDPQDDICICCVTGNIMKDIEKCKTLGGQK